MQLCMEGWIGANKEVLQNNRKIFDLNSHISLNQETHIKFWVYFQPLINILIHEFIELNSGKDFPHVNILNQILMSVSILHIERIEF